MKKLDYLAYTLLAFGLWSIYANLQNATPQYLIWLCNHTAFIMGLALLYRNAYWVQVQLNLGLIPQLLWSIDFLGKVFFDTYIFKLTEYMFVANYPVPLYIMSMGHLVMPFVAIYALHVMGKQPFAWLGTLAHIVILIPVSLYWAAEYNLNCMFDSCIPFVGTTAYYQMWWPLFVFAMGLLTNVLIRKLLKSKTIKHHTYK